MRPSPVLLTFTGKRLSFSPTIITILDCNYSLLLNYSGTKLNAILLSVISFTHPSWLNSGQVRESDTSHDI